MRRLTCAAVLAALLAACAGVGGESRGDRAPIDHVVVLFLENRAFDHLFGTYPGADGLANYTGRQVDKSGVTYRHSAATARRTRDSPLTSRTRRSRCCASYRPST